MANKRIKILQVISGLDIGGGHGGAERFGLELGRSLDRNTFEVSIWAFWQRETSFEDHWRELLESEKIPIFFGSRWKGKFNLRSYLSGVAKIIRFGKMEKIDVVHSHFQMGTLAALSMKFFGGIKSVIRTAHITREWGEGFVAWMMRSLFTNWLFPISLDLEIGVSNALLRQLQNHPGARLFRRKPKLIHNAINITEIQRSPRTAQLERKDGEFIVGSVGRLVRQKGYKYLLSAAEVVLKEVSNVKFIVIGDGDQRDKLVELADLQGIGEKITFLGQSDDVIHHIRSMDLFVLPSLWEGFPTVLLECMASGVPIIATDVQGTRELIEDKYTGWLVPPKSAKVLAKTIIDVLGHSSKRTEIASNAMSDVKKYSIKKISDKYKEVYCMTFDRKSE